MNSIVRTILSHFREDHNALWIELEREQISTDQFAAMLHSCAREAGCDLYRATGQPMLSMTSLALGIAEMSASLATDIALNPGVYHLEGQTAFDNALATIDEWRSNDDTPQSSDGNPDPFPGGE